MDQFTFLIDIMQFMRFFIRLCKPMMSKLTGCAIRGSSTLSENRDLANWLIGLERVQRGDRALMKIAAAVVA